MPKYFLVAFLTVFISLLGKSAFAEEDGENPPPGQNSVGVEQPPPPPRHLKPKRERRQFVTDHPERSDAGVFHAAFAAGGNFYVEPVVDANKTPQGDYFKDFGFQAGAYFDYDYSEVAENIPLMLRGMGGYKYILSSVHVFTFDGLVRRMFRFSESVGFGLGMGGSAAVWFRSASANTNEEVIFLPSFIVGAGFEFNPFMVDFKWLINKFGQDSTITGVELYFGFRL